MHVVSVLFEDALNELLCHVSTLSEHFVEFEFETYLPLSVLPTQTLNLLPRLAHIYQLLRTHPCCWYAYHILYVSPIEYLIGPGLDRPLEEITPFFGSCRRTANLPSAKHFQKAKVIHVTILDTYAVSLRIDSIRVLFFGFFARCEPHKYLAFCVAIRPRVACSVCYDLAWHQVASKLRAMQPTDWTTRPAGPDYKCDGLSNPPNQIRLKHPNPRYRRLRRSHTIRQSEQ